MLEEIVATARQSHSHHRILGIVPASDWIPPKPRSFCRSAFLRRTLIIELVSDRIEPEFCHFTTPRQVRHTQWCGLVTLHRFAHQSSEAVLILASCGESRPHRNVSTGRHHRPSYSR